MSIITLPAECALQLAGFSLGQQRFDITEQSDGNGNTATRLGAPPRWRASLRSLPAMVAADAARWKGLQLGLRGRINHLALWDITNPQPRGTARGALVTSGSTAAGATSAMITGAIALPNIMAGGSFEIDTNADGLADGWTRYSAGSFSTLSAALSAGMHPHGATSQALLAAMLGATSSDRQGIFRSGVDVSALAGLPATLSFVVLGTLNSSMQFELAWRDAGGSVIGSMSTGAVALTTGLQSLSVSGTAPALAATAIIYAYQHSNTGASPSFYIDAVQLEQAAAPTAYAGFATLLQGDWLQIGTGVGSHYCMVSADATFNDAGTATVSFEPPLRQAIAGSTVVAWHKPLCHYRQTADAATWDAVPGSSDVGSFQLELIEDWRA